MRLSRLPDRSQKSSVTWLAMILLVVSSLCLISFSAATAKTAPKKAADPVVVMETNKGIIKIDIYEADAPKTAANFVGLVNRGFYNGLTFHRYEPGFCIQGGDPLGTGAGGSKVTIPLETSPALVLAKPQLRHSAAGVIAMARTNDPNSASSQFYFTLGPANFLDGQYAVFGKVVDGLDTVMQLRKGDKMTKVYIEKK